MDKYICTLKTQIMFTYNFALCHGDQVNDTRITDIDLDLFDDKYLLAFLISDLPTTIITRIVKHYIQQTHFINVYSKPQHNITRLCTQVPDYLEMEKMKLLIYKE